MATVGTLGPAQLQSWMVAKLFNTQVQTGSSGPINNTPAVGTSANKVAGSTLSAISFVGDNSALDPATRNAPWKTITLSYNTSTRQISGLTDNIYKEFSDYVTGPDLPPVAPGMPPQQKQLGIVGEMLQIKQINEMTSQQITDAYYGSGLPVNDYYHGNFVDGPKLTFASFVRDNQDTVAGLKLETQVDPMSDDMKKEILADADRIAKQTSDIQDAYNNKTLKFMKLADIPGSNYSASITYSTSNAVKDVGTNESYDKTAVEAYVAQHPNSMWNTIGGVSMIWSW